MFSARSSSAQPCRRLAAAFATVAAAALAATCAQVQAQVAPDPPTPPAPSLPAQPDAATRGALLYNTHCVECHNTEKHWRDLRRAVDWRTLREQVAFWQARAMLGWTDADVLEVARYLNDTIYHYPRDDAPVRAFVPNAPPQPFAAALARPRRGR